MARGVKMDAPSGDSFLEIVGCADGGVSFGLEMACVRGVERADRLVRRAGPHGAVGVFSEGGSDRPVYRLADLLAPDGCAALEGASNLVVIHGEDGPFGLLVQDLWPVARVSKRSVFPLPASVAGHCGSHFRGLLQLEDRLALWLAPQWLPNPGRRAMPADPGSLGNSEAWWRELGFKPPEPLGRSSPGAGRIVIFSPVDLPDRKRPLAFGLFASQVLEIVDPQSVIRLPEAPNYLLGLTLWRERAVPVIDLSLRLGLGSATPGPRTRLLIARASAGSEPVAFPIEPPIRVRRLPLPHVACAKMPPLHLALAKGTVELDQGTLVIPDLAAVSNLTHFAG
jgi:chemotaxis signal transduction protein